MWPNSKKKLWPNYKRKHRENREKLPWELVGWGDKKKLWQLKNSKCDSNANDSSDRSSYNNIF